MNNQQVIDDAIIKMSKDNAAEILLTDFIHEIEGNNYTTIFQVLGALHNRIAKLKGESDE